jgi:hypothetical protein
MVDKVRVVQECAFGSVMSIMPIVLLAFSWRAAVVDESRIVIMQSSRMHAERLVFRREHM